MIPYFKKSPAIVLCSYTEFIKLVSTCYSLLKKIILVSPTSIMSLLASLEFYGRSWQTMALTVFSLNIFFRSNCRFTGSCKEMYREILCSLCQASASVNMLNKYSIISKPGNWHWYNPQFIHISPATHASVCMCVYSCAIS